MRVSEQLRAKRLKTETSSGRLYATALSNTVTQSRVFIQSTVIAFIRRGNRPNETIKDQNLQ